MIRNSPEWLAKKSQMDELCKLLPAHPHYMPLIVAIEELADELGLPVNE